MHVFDAFQEHNYLHESFIHTDLVVCWSREQEDFL